MLIGVSQLEVRTTHNIFVYLDELEKKGAREVLFFLETTREERERREMGGRRGRKKIK